MLSVENQKELIDIADYEILNHLCDSVPKYQSYANMHEKYSEKESFQKLITNIKQTSYALLGFDVDISSCWFNVVKHDSVFGFHKHKTITAIYYLKNCSGNGTIIEKNDETFSLYCLDNTINFIGFQTVHSVPKWDGRDRYTIALDLKVLRN